VVDVSVVRGDALLGGTSLDELSDLWLSLFDHHEQVGPGPVIERDRSWALRRAVYEQVLADPDAFAVLARAGSQLVGYAMVAMHRGADDTWPTGDRYAEVETLVVAPELRGQGLGSTLLDAVDAELHAMGVGASFIAVMIGNDDAERFYRRRGYHPVITKLMRVIDQ
jgi:ribosomal protein S18 acetylase RimI-like enzyme